MVTRHIERRLSLRRREPKKRDEPPSSCGLALRPYLGFGSVGAVRSHPSRMYCGGSRQLNVGSLRLQAINPATAETGRPTTRLATRTHEANDDATRDANPRRDPATKLGSCPRKSTIHY